MGVVDVFDALTSDRPYRKAMLPSDAIEYIMGGYNTMFDPSVVNVLTRKVAPYPVGTCIRLSTGVITSYSIHYTKLYELRYRIGKRRRLCRLHRGFCCVIYLCKIV